METLFKFTYENGPVAQRLEQGTHNSSLTSCARFHSVALYCGRWVSRPFRIRTALRRIAQFCTKILRDRRIDRRKMHSITASLAPLTERLDSSRLVPCPRLTTACLSLSTGGATARSCSLRH